MVEQKVLREIPEVLPGIKSSFEFLDRIVVNDDIHDIVYNPGRLRFTSNGKMYCVFDGKNRMNATHVLFSTLYNIDCYIGDSFSIEVSLLYEEVLDPISISEEGKKDLIESASRLHGEEFTINKFDIRTSKGYYFFGNMYDLRVDGDTDEDMGKLHRILYGKDVTSQ